MRGKEQFIEGKRGRLPENSGLIISALLKTKTGERFSLGDLAEIVGAKSAYVDDVLRRLGLRAARKAGLQSFWKIPDDPEFLRKLRAYQFELTAREARVIEKRLKKTGQRIG